MLKRIHLLAAEFFNYSYANYDDHLGINIRFDKLMPNDVKIMEKAERESWSDQQVARALKVDVEKVHIVRENFQRAKDIVDAPNLAVSFRRSIRYAIKYAVEQGIHSNEDIENLVQQICYRAADLAYLLDINEANLSVYSEELRKGYHEFADEAS